MSRPPKKLDRHNPLPLYHQLRMALLDRIGAGEFRPGDPLPSERQLAADYEVSRITVIQALKALEREGVIERRQGQGTFVVEPTRRERKSLASNRTVAFLAPVLTDPFLFDIVRGVERIATHHGYHLVMMCSHEDPAQEASLIREAQTRGVHGAVVYPIQGDASHAVFQDLLAQGYPFVFIDRYYPGLSVDRVVTDDHDAAYAITDRLIQHGHRRIAFVTWYEVTCTSVRERIAGYRAALYQHHLDPHPGLIWRDLYVGDKKDGNNPEHLRRLLHLHRPTALIAVNFIIAGYLLDDLQRCGLRVPQDVVIAGFDLDHPSIRSPLTRPAAIQQGAELGQAAARLLIDRIEGGYQGPARHIVVPTRLILEEPAVLASARG